MTDLHADAKRAAARAAADLVETGMRVGLGTGSTFTHALDRLAERMRDEGLELVGVPTSEATAARAHELGIPLTTLDAVDRLDLAIDGADEVDPAKNLVKGGGGALTREKIVAAVAGRIVVVVGENKLVDWLGQTFRLPVEVMEFGARQVARRLETEFGWEPELRMQGAVPYLTDNGNWIYDCRVPAAFDPAPVETALNCIPGVVENGLFVGLTGAVLVGNADGSVRRID